MALKLVDDVKVGGFDDELSATEIAYLAKNFRNFLRNNNRKVRGVNTTEPRNFRKNDPLRLTIMTNLEKKYVNLLIILWLLNVLDVKGMVT